VFFAILPLLLSLLLMGCGGGDGGGGGGEPTGAASSLTAVELIGPGVECPSGGQRIYYGIDSNNNGVLDVSERNGYEVVCHGLGGAPNPMLPPEGPAAQYAIQLDGGAGGDGTGGAGGSMVLNFSNGSRTGHILLFETGVANTAFALPDPVATHLGWNPLVISENATVETYGVEHVVLSPFEVHAHYDSAGLYVADEFGSGDSIATGLRVEAGVTLTLTPNWGGDSPSVNFSFQNDVHNRGTITVEKSGFNSFLFQLSCALFHGEAGSMIDLSGGDNVGIETSGGNGGTLYIAASYWIGGGFYNAGTIVTSGGAGDAGGGAGDVQIYADMVFNTGDMTTNGGSGGITTGWGGNAGSISLYAYESSIYNSGNLSATGGVGYSGGTGGYIELSTNEEVSYGHVVNGGNLTGSGGNSNSTVAAGNGGGGGSFTLQAGGGSVISSGDLTFKGGDGVFTGGAALSSQIYANEGYNSEFGIPVPPGDIVISGNVDLRGGSGANGGGIGGTLVLQNNPYQHPKGQNILLLGYQQITADGGDGNGAAGDGGDFAALQAPSIVYNFSVDLTPVVIYGPGGAIVNYVDFLARGGDGPSAESDFQPGGLGGSFRMVTDDDITETFANWRRAVNFGDVDLSAGSGEGGAPSGGFYLYGYDGAENHGALTTIGGTALGDGGSGGSSAVAPGPVTGIRIHAPLGRAVNAGTITATGGSAPGEGEGSDWGGSGPYIEIFGNSARVTGDILATGGAATDPGSGTGGEGGWIQIFGQAFATEYTATFDYSGGSGGSEDGSPGGLAIDGMNVGGTDWPD